MAYIDLPLPSRAEPPVVRTAPAPASGLVTLLGAGPGDPDLLTVQAVKALQSASLVLYDHLVGQEVLQLLPPQADRIYVGKESSRHTLSQEAIIELMVRLARGGRSLLRLKGGDGYIFGRGGEEAEALARAGVPFRVLPGLTAAQGAAAAVGIPLTHREHGRALVLATGHGREGAELSLDWPLLARPGQTVVLYMGVAHLPQICDGLIAHGRDPSTPAAVVERATLPDQRCITGTLATLPALARAHRVQAPALIFVGEVVQLQAVLAPAMALAAPPMALA
jgi:uroporphyrin-III C-methyltransferase